MEKCILALVCFFAEISAEGHQIILKKKLKIPNSPAESNIQRIEGNSKISAVGSALKGYSYYYEQDRFRGYEDGISGSQPTILINLKNNKAVYMIKDAVKIIYKSELEIIDISEDWISFSGTVNDAPTLISLYRPHNILYVSQHTIRNNTPKANLFYSKCHLCYTQ